MTAGPTFSDILTSALRSWGERNSDECVLSLALPIRGVDPFNQFSILAEGHQFRFLWDSSPGLCIAASGQTQNLDLIGPRRFELAQRFSDATLGRLLDATPEAPLQARPRILLAFSFFEQTSESKRALGIPPAAQAVLPRWQLTRQGFWSWIRLNCLVLHEADARELVEHLWLMRERLSQKSLERSLSTGLNSVSGSAAIQQSQACYQASLAHGIDLVSKGALEKLVLAVRQSILLKSPLDPLIMLSRLRKQQTGSCRFLWQCSQHEAFFGASPERLLSLRQGQLRSDALAGTASRDDDESILLRSDKDLREHEMVVRSITHQLTNQGLSVHRPRRPRLARHGQLVHLHTPITANASGQLPLHLVDALHPTPAVAGLPRRDAMAWLRTLEPFDRGRYAAPIGWIDSAGNAEFRVAIRCGNTTGNKLDLTAGAGLVRGSVAEKELKEVRLKLAVLADQLDLEPADQGITFSSRVIT